MEPATTAVESHATDIPVLESLEDLHARHKKEQRDLTARVTALKKTATKGDKKKKKEVLAEVATLESNLGKQQAQEEKDLVAALKAAGGDDTEADGAETSKSAQEEDEEDDFDPNDIPIDHLIVSEEPIPHLPPPVQSSQGKKTNRQKARKDRKAQALKELQDEAEQEAAGQVNMNEVEKNAIQELASVMGVQVKEITADGHCLYNAIADQLLQTCNKTTTFKEQRQVTAQYMREHPDDFLPYMTNKQGDIMSLQDYEDYCTELETTAVWGGQLELMAMSKVHEVPIWVVQMGSPTVKLSADSYPTKKPLMVSYHRHMYGLGEHYNSLREQK